MNNNPNEINKDRLLVAMEFSNSKWLIGFYNGEKVRRRNIEAQDQACSLREVVTAQ
ncbi:MAG: hypothetical protein PF495_06210 [Spirochaetales bacterium]|jgi:hypothetical protein|nr:hypothetical protein [Spirochaetales bacterium]